MKRLALAALGAALFAQGASAQENTGAAAPCGDPRVPQSAQQTCTVVAQALESAQPQLGILLAGGNPTLGTASTGGIRLGVLPRISATVKANVVLVRLPDILAEAGGGRVQELNERVGIPAPALSGTLSAGLYPGISLAPTVGGVGAVDLLASASWLPLEPLGVEGFGRSTSDFAWGVGARVGILRESFTTPGISVSGMYRRMGDLGFGDVCAQPAAATEETREGYRLQYGACTGGGNAGEFTADLTDLSGRAAISKRLFGWGLTAGVGYDRFESDAGFGFRGACPTGTQQCFFRVSELEVDNDRWSAFANASFTALVATLALEAGWLQGAEPLRSFRNLRSEFDPKTGTFFGSIGLRVSL